MKMIQTKDHNDSSNAVPSHYQLCLQHDVVQLKWSAVSLSYSHEEETNYSIQLCSCSKTFCLSQYEHKHTQGINRTYFEVAVQITAQYTCTERSICRQKETFVILKLAH